VSNDGKGVIDKTGSSMHGMCDQGNQRSIGLDKNPFSSALDDLDIAKKLNHDATSLLGAGIRRP
jgi:hypothetical protein